MSLHHPEGVRGESLCPALSALPREAEIRRLHSGTDQGRAARPQDEEDNLEETVASGMAQECPFRWLRPRKAIWFLKMRLFLKCTFRIILYPKVRQPRIHPGNGLPRIQSKLLRILKVGAPPAGCFVTRRRWD